MSKFKNFFLVFILVLFQCNPSNTKSKEFQLSWEFANAEESESIESVYSKEFKPVPKESPLADLLPEKEGYLWLRSSFNTNDSGIPELPSLLFGKFVWAEETYLNGQLIGTTLEREKWNLWNLYRLYPVSKDLFMDSNTLYVKLYLNAEGSAENFVILGETKDLEKIWFGKMFYESYMNGIVSILFFVIAAYHFLIYIKRTKDTENIYYAVFCFLFAFYSMNFISNMFYQKITNLNINYVIFQKFVFTMMATSAFMLYKFICIFLKRKERVWLIWLFNILLVVDLLLILIPWNYRLMYQFRGISTVLVFPYMLYIIIIPFRELKKGNIESKTIMPALVALGIVAVHDVVVVIFRLDWAFLAGFGLPLFTFSMMFILANRFVNVHNQTDELNENLEVKVKERTKEVTEKMEEVKALKVQQDGDYYLTSLIEKPLGTNFNKSQYIKTDFIIKQKKEFDFKGRNSELGGDICITGNLRFGDGKERFLFYFNGDAMGKSMQGAGGAIVAGTVVNSILGRSARNNKIIKLSPEEWLTETYIELDNVFQTFDGSMLMSAAVGIINERTGDMWFFNAEHPWTVLYRDGIAVFLEKHSDLRKLGTKIPTEFVIHKYRLMKGDVVICGSDGRDDIELSTKDGVREINENEELFLRNVEKGKGDIRQISNEILKLGKLTDDLSLLRIGFKENMDETEQILVGDGYYDRRSYAECIPHYERALFIAPENTNVWFKLSVAYKHLGNYPESKYACLKVYHKEPERFANLINLADNFRLLHEEEDAWKFTQLAKKIAPDHESVKKLEEALSKK